MATRKIDVMVNIKVLTEKTPLRLEFSSKEPSLKPRKHHG